MGTEHRYREHWVNVAHVGRVERGTRPDSLLLLFDNQTAMTEALETMCTGREVHGDGIRHDQGKHCPVHPNHDDR